MGKASAWQHGFQRDLFSAVDQLSDVSWISDLLLLQGWRQRLFQLLSFALVRHNQSVKVPAAPGLSNGRVESNKAWYNSGLILNLVWVPFFLILTDRASYTMGTLPALGPIFFHNQQQLSVNQVVGANQLPSFLQFRTVANIFLDFFSFFLDFFCFSCFVAGAVLCGPCKAHFVAGAVLCGPCKAHFVAGAGLCGPWSAEFVAGAGLFVGLEVQISWQV